MSSKNQIVVTGGAGYIGSHTVLELYSAGFEAIIIDDFRNSKPWILDRIEELIGEKPIHYAIDCSDEKALDEVFSKHQNILGLIHFAADKAVGESVNQPLKYYNNNLNSLTNILSLMQKHKVDNIVFSSSCTVYGTADKIPVTEKNPRKPAESPYGNTK